MNTQLNMPHAADCRCCSWKPIFAGALTAFGFTFLLNLFSVAIGLTAYTTTKEGVEMLALGGLIATCLGLFVSMFASGWIAGYLGNCCCSKRHCAGVLRGFLAWCVALIIAIFFTTHARDYVIYYNHFISGTPMVTMAPSTETTTATQVVISSYIVFGLFFLSAFATSIGGYCGACCSSKNKCETRV